MFRNYLKYVFICLSVVLFSCDKDDDDDDKNNFEKIYTEGEGLTDVDGNHYKSIILGDQEWMAENLRTTRYANGEPIMNVTGDSQWGNLSDSKTGAWCWYDNNSDFDNPYGKLYNWFAVDNSNGLCPTGWRVPSREDWINLRKFVDPEESLIFNTAGGMMKATGTSHWKDPNVDATNQSGFSGLPGGYRIHSSGFSSMEVGGYWWSANFFVYPHQAYNFTLRFENKYLSQNSTGSTSGNSVRCIKN